MQLIRLVLHQQGKTGCVHRLVGRTGADVQRPFHPSHIGQVRLLGQLLAGAHKFRQARTPLGQIAFIGWAGVPKSTGQRRRTLCPQQLREHRVGRLQSALRIRMTVGLISF